MTRLPARIIALLVVRQIGRAKRRAPRFCPHPYAIHSPEARICRKLSLREHRKNDNVAGDEGERVASLVAAYRDAVRKKREHTPVYQVGAVPLGGVFAGDVRAAAENSLAGRRLLACASVTGTARRHKRRITDRALERKRLLCRFNACGGRVSLVSGQVGIAVDPGFAVARELSYRGAENVGAVNVIGIASRQGETRESR